MIAITTKDGAEICYKEWDSVQPVFFSPRKKRVEKFLLVCTVMPLAETVIRRKGM
jgi:hypothetical protein